MTQIKFVFLKIKAHQDDICAYDELDPWEQANVRADSLAKQYLTEYQQQHTTCMIDMSVVDTSAWLLMINNIPIGNNVKQRVTTQVWSLRGKHFWCKRLKIPMARTQYIWWDVIESISKSLPDFKRQRYTKLMANIAPVSVIMNQRDPSMSDKCPLCSESETNMHLWNCRHSAIEELFLRGVKDINLWLQMGPESIKGLFQSIFEHLRNGQEIQYFSELPEVSTIIKAQLSLTVYGTLWGFYHRAWEAILLTHFEKSWRSPVTWLSTLTIKLWALWDTLWEYQNNAKHHMLSRRDEYQHVQQRIKEIYASLPDQRMLMPAELSFFQKPLKERLTQPIRMQRKWTRDATIILQFFQSKENESASVKLFRTYFSAKRRKVVTTADLAKDGG